MTCRSVFLCLTALCLATLAGAATPTATKPPTGKDERHTDAAGREYFFYLPRQIDTNKTYWLVVGVHGAGGNGRGAGGFSGWTALGNCIVVGPSFPEGYQGLDNATDTQLINLAEQLGKTYKLHSRIFVTGFSGGSQFAHRFALQHPDNVIGCAAHSGGTWAGLMQGDVVLSEKAAAQVPFAISCGQQDTGKAFEGANLPRIEWAHSFEASLKQQNFLYKAQYWPGTGHALTPGAIQLSEECYWLSITGLMPAERKQLDQLFAGIETYSRFPVEGKRRAKLIPAEFAKIRAKPAMPTATRPATTTAPSWSATAVMRAELNKRTEEYIAERCADYSRNLH